MTSNYSTYLWGRRSSPQIHLQVRGDGVRVKAPLDIYSLSGASHHNTVSCIERKIIYGGNASLHSIFGHRTDKPVSWLAHHVV